MDRTIQADSSASFLSDVTEARVIEITVLQQFRSVVVGALLDSAGPVLRIALPSPVPQNAAVKADLGDTVLLGDICYCRPTEDGYEVGLAVQHKLEHLSELEQLGRALRGFESSRSAAPSNVLRA